MITRILQYLSYYDAYGCELKAACTWHILTTAYMHTICSMPAMMCRVHIYGDKHSINILIISVTHM